MFFWCVDITAQQQKDISKMENCLKKKTRWNGIRSLYKLSKKDLVAFCMNFILLFSSLALHGWSCSSRPGRVLDDQIDPWQLCLLCWISSKPLPPTSVPRIFAYLKKEREKNRYIGVRQIGLSIQANTSDGNITCGLLFFCLVQNIHHNLYICVAFVDQTLLKLVVSSHYNSLTFKREFNI